MEDLERYGDYNDTEDDRPKGKSPVGLILKILVGVICAAVAGVLIFRVIIFNYYPKSMSKLYFDDVLTEHYNALDGKINVKTQSLRAPYDDPNVGNFFCDNLLVIPEADQLQVSVRFNTSIVASVKEKYGVDIDIKDLDIFSFRLVRNPLTDKGEPVEIGRLDAVRADEYMMYRYFKLVFNDVDFGLDDGESKVEWIRLEIRIKGVDTQKPIVDSMEKRDAFMIPIYENNEGYNRLKTYKLSKKEKP